MTQIDEPNLDELDELQKECNINEYGDIDVNGHYIFKRFREILADQVAKARINELENLLADDGQCICQLADQKVCDHNWSLCNTVKDRIAQLRSTK